MAQDIIERYRQLPQSYGKDTIVLLGQQPGIMFAYWEITARGADEARKKLGGGFKGMNPVVQLLSQDGSVLQQDHVSDWIGRYYFRNVPQGVVFFARIGFEGQDGSLGVVAQSAVVESYRAGLGAPGPIIFAKGVKSADGRRKLITPEEETRPGGSQVDTKDMRERLPLGYSRMVEK